MCDTDYIARINRFDTHESRAHVKSRVLGVHYRHVAQRDVKSVSEYRNLKFSFKLWFVEAWKCRACVRRFEMGCCEVPKVGRERERERKKKKREKEIRLKIYSR